MKLYNTLPCMEVPDGILAIAIRSSAQLLSENVEVFVHGQGVVSVTGRNEVRYRAGRNTQSAQYLKRNFTSNSISPN